MNTPRNNHHGPARRWPALISTLAATLVVAGCATEVANFVPIGAPRPAKSVGHPIDIFTNGVPSRAYDRVAILDVHCESQGFMTPNLEKDAIPKFIELARKAGCDAVIEIEDRTANTSWSLETKTKHFTGTGVAYK